MGLLSKLFGRDDDGEDRSAFSFEGKHCARCNQPIVTKDNFALDIGGGKPIHRECPPKDAVES